MKYSYTLLVCICIIHAHPIHAFTNISGKIIDTSGAVVPDALVVITDKSDPSMQMSTYTDQNGEYTITPQSTSADEETPSSFMLYQNYPNPFNPSTSIRFSLGKADFVSLVIYNVIGQQVRTLMDSYNTAGVHAVTWDGRDDSGANVGAGLYLYCLKSGNLIQTRKMLLIDGGYHADANKSGPVSMNTTPPEAMKKSEDDTAYRLTITKPGIVPYVMDIDTLQNGVQYDFIVPRADDPYKLVLLKDIDTPVVAVLMSDTGESFALLADRSANGDIERISGGMYIGQNDNNLALWINDNESVRYSNDPGVAVTGDGWFWKLTEYSTYAEDTVNMYYITPDNNVQYVDRVPLDGTRYYEFGILRNQPFGNAIGIRDTSKWAFKNYISSSISGTAIGLSIAASAGRDGSFKANLPVPVVQQIADNSFLHSVISSVWTNDYNGVQGDITIGGGSVHHVSGFIYDRDVVSRADHEASQIIGKIDNVLIACNQVENCRADKPFLHSVKGIIRYVAPNTRNPETHITLSSPDYFANKLLDDVEFFLLVPNGTYTLITETGDWTTLPESQQIIVADKDVGTSVVATNIGTFQEHNDITFVSIPEGTFKMGDEIGDFPEYCRPVHTVSMSSFLMSAFEITNAEYARYLNNALDEGAVTITTEGIYGTKGDYTQKFYGQLSDYLIYDNVSVSIRDGYEKMPVTHVSWYGARSFALYYGFDLPTEAEWEYACRGGVQCQYGTYNCRYERYSANWDDVFDRIMEVGNFAQNPFGLFDMSGNVSEWCFDLFDEHYYQHSPDFNPSGPARQYSLNISNVIRGSSWETRFELCGSSFRWHSSPSGINTTLGFRVVKRDTEPQSGYHTLSGQVLTNGTGEAHVEVYLIGDYELATTTDADGRFSCLAPSGAYYVRFAKSGYSFEPSEHLVWINDADYEIPVVEATFTGAPHENNDVTLVSIPGGQFEMGDEDGDLQEYARPVHSVTVSSYEMGAYEISNAQYASWLNDAYDHGEVAVTTSIVMGTAGPFTEQVYIDLTGYKDADNRCWIQFENDHFDVVAGKENLPVVFVTWYGAKAYAQYYGFDLPTEAEWEYAARGGQQYRYATDDGTISSENANYGAGDHKPTDIGSYPPNPFGLYDMSGNVYERCYDIFDVNTYGEGPATDPFGGQTGMNRIIRGGDWLSSHHACRTATRVISSTQSNTSRIGFRIVRRSASLDR